MYKILIFPGWFPSKENPLNAIFTKKHVEIIACENEVSVVYAEKVINQDEKYVLEFVEGNNYNCHICYYRGSRHLITSIRKVINFYRRILSYIKSINATGTSIENFDFIHIHVISFEALIPIYYKITKRVRYFVSEHSTMYSRKVRKYSFENTFKRFIVRNGAGLSMVSEALKLEMKNLNITHPNTMVIPNYVDDKKFKSVISEKRSSFRFLHVSRLDEKAKNVVGILRAFEKVYETNQNIELYIVGGSLGVISEAEKYSSKLKCKANVFFEGLKFDDEIVSYFNKADLLIMFSNYETQGVVVIEALFCGVPVLATSLPCFKEYLHKKNSVLINPKDDFALVQNIQSFIRGEWLTWSPDQIRGDIKQKFSMQMIQSDFSKLYSKGLT